jgi:hypothetical protein
MAASAVATSVHGKVATAYLLLGGGVGAGVGAGTKCCVGTDAPGLGSCGTSKCIVGAAFCTKC